MTDYTDPENNRRAPIPQGWHLDRKVPISLIITIIGLFLAGMSAYGDLKREIALMQADISVLHKSDDKQADALKDALASLQSQLNRIDANLYRLIERGAK
jgi:hypothetical protein